MATLGNKKTFSGMVGNVVFKNLNGKQIAQSRPARVKQTTATKKSASEFGECSQWARQLRHGLTPFLVGLTDSTMHSRFSAALYNTVKSNTAVPKGERNPVNSDMDALCSFEFNTHSPFALWFRPTLSAALTDSGEVTVAFDTINPEADIMFPNRCDKAKLAVYVYATDFKDNSQRLTFHSLLSIDKRSSISAQTILTTPAIPQGYFVLVAAKLLYYNSNILTENNYLNTKTFSPAMVLLAKTV